VGFVVDKVALGQVFSPSISVFPRQFHYTSAPLQGKTEETNHLITGLHNKPLRQRCFRSFCCGVLHHKKKGTTLKDKEEKFLLKSF
jgi:hypothetical protein